MSEREIPEREIPEEKLTKRQFFKRGAAAAALVADVIYAAKIGTPEYEINDENVKIVDKAASEMFNHIKQKRSTFKTEQGGTVDAYVDKKNFSRILAGLAYLNGGKKDLVQISKFVKERKMILSINDHNFSLAMVKPSSAPSESIEVSFGTYMAKRYYDKFANKSLMDNTIYHEAYHCIQIAKNPELFYKLQWGGTLLSVGAGIYLGIKQGNKIYEDITSPSDSESEKKLTRQKILGNIARAATIPVASTINSYEFYGLLNPIELQTYFQTGMDLRKAGAPLVPEISVLPTIPGMLESKYFEQTKGKGFKFYPQ